MRLRRLAEPIGQLHAARVSRSDALHLERAEIDNDAPFARDLLIVGLDCVSVAERGAGVPRLLFIHGRKLLNFGGIGRQGQPKSIDAHPE